ncbi:MAG: response regulator [Caldilinea sp.]|nr:response regulator [Caldilinea sp.]MDW8441352.1 response regulator [Caldilineaceae bacterium]
METILLLMEKEQDRRLLEEYLGGAYRIQQADPDRLLGGTFDLCIVDGLMLKRHRDLLAARKSAQDVYLPVLLVTAKRQLSLLTSGLWKIVDDLICTPIHKAELRVRIEILLRARRFSTRALAQQEQHWQQLMRYIVEHDPSAIAVLDKELRYVYVSQRYGRDFGVQEQNLVGKHLYEVFPETPERWREMYRRSLAGEVLQVDEDSFERTNGKIEWIRWECRPWYETNGAIGGIVLYIEVITDRKLLEEQLRQAQKLETIGQLAGGVAHDFNNMLSVIRMQTEMALMTLSPGHPHHHRFQEIRKAAERSAQLTQQLLAFARKQPIAPNVLNLNDLVPDTLRILRRLIGEHIELIWKPAPQLWSVKLDPVQVDQLLANLCVNARDAIEGVGRIVIETHNVVIDALYCKFHPDASPGEYVQLSVSDTGCGMDKETLRRVFEPFFTTKEVGRGTGLGLATVYGIVKQNNGFINVYSEVGVGSTFKIYIPRHIEDAPSSPSGDGESLRFGHGETILLVEDEESVLEVTKSILEELGYRVLAAGTPRQALQLTDQSPTPPVLVLTDVIMPEMNGRELVERLRVLVPSIRAIFMSGYAVDIVGHQGVLEQDVHYIQKPFSIRELATKIRAVLGRA